MSLSDGKQKLEVLHKLLTTLKSDIRAGNVDSCIKCTNATRRELYSRVELLRIDFEEYFEAHPDENGEILTEINDELNSLAKLLPLVPLITTRTAIKKMSTLTQILRVIDIVIRFFAGVFGFITVGVLLSLPVIMLQIIDNKFLIPYGIVDSYSQLSERVRRKIGQFFLLISGIVVHVEGLDVCFPQKKNLALRSAESTGTNTGGCSILAFTHSSNLDGFLISATCPVKHFALAKKELFMVPFFSWISLAIGGVPVDRNNRERAIGALQRSVDAVKDSRACLVVAPEGTRSTTGHLFGFKKGTFHMWEQMKVPIIPLVFVGAFDLYPKGNWVNDTGNVIIRYLPPIKPEEATSRDQMSRLLRRRILDSLCETSSDVLVTPLSWMQWSVHYSAILMLFVVDYFLYQLWLYIIYGYFQLENKTSIFLCASGISMGITLALYVYYVYIIGSSNEKKQKQK